MKTMKNKKDESYMKNSQQIFDEINRILDECSNPEKFDGNVFYNLGILKDFILSEDCIHTPDDCGLGHCTKCGKAL